MNPLLDGDPEDYDPLASSQEAAGTSVPAAKMNPLIDEVSKPWAPQKSDVKVSKPDASTTTSKLTAELTQTGSRAPSTKVQVLQKSEPEVVKPSAASEPVPDPRVDALMRSNAEAMFKPLITRRGSLREGSGVG